MKKIISIFVAVSILFSSVMVNAAFWNALPEFTRLADIKDYDTLNELIMLDERDIVQSTATVQVNIDENTIIGNRNERLFGTGGEAFNNMIDFVDPVTGENTEEWKKFSKEIYKIPMVRFGGHASNKVNLITQIGPLAQRTKAQIPDDIEIERFYLDYGKTSLTTPSAEISIMGTAEYMRVFLENNPDTEFILTTTVTHGQPEDTANLVRFCLDDKDESEWGALRAQYLREEPVNLVCIELGNELYANPFYSEEINDSKRKWYVDICKKHIEAIRKYYPDLDISAVICSNGADPARDKNGFGFDHWNPYIIKELGQLIDIFSFHLYHSGYEVRGKTHEWVERTEDYFIEFFGPDHGKTLAITEGSKWATDAFAAITMESGLATSSYLDWWNEHIDLLYCYTYYCFYSGRWAQVDKTIEGNWVPTPVGMVYKLYQDNMGDRIVTSSLDWSEQEKRESEGADIYNPIHFSAGVSAEGDDLLKVIISNREPYKEVEANFSFNNNYTLVEETVFRANNQKSLVFSDKNKDAFHITTTEKNEKNFNYYKVPNESMVILTLKSDKKIPQFGETDAEDGEATYSGETNFADIEHHWASNEINILASEGIVSGDENSMFNPNDNITRAEFAALLCKALNATDESYAEVFNDVNADKWYADYVYSTWKNGYIRGNQDNNFLPENNLNMKDTTEILYRVCSSKIANTEVVDAESYITASQLDKISSEYGEWNTEALAYVVKNGLINKFYETDNYNPKDSVTRAEAAVMIYRLRKLIGAEGRRPIT